MSGTWNLTRTGQSFSTAESISAPEEINPRYDLNGVYASKIVRKDNHDYWCFNSKRKFLIELEQSGKIIKGKFLSGITGEIIGTLNGEKVAFNWYTTKCARGYDGEWTISEDGSVLQGYGFSELDWSATKNE